MTSESKIDIRSLFPSEIKDILLANGMEGYRAGQIFSWLYKGAVSFNEMTDISKAQREKLDTVFYMEKMSAAESVSSKIDETTKYLFTLSDGEYVESVLLSYKHGYSVCLSTQAGCRMGCSFCASAKAGFSRNLRPSEILNQMEEITRDKRKSDPAFRISHIVLMGIGEPLDNYDNVLKFLRLVNLAEGFGVGFRNISLSTCGIIPKIFMLAEEDIPLTLSVSLHAPDSALRSTLMPINQKYPLPALMAACREYTQKSGKRISFEYALISGVNDTPVCAEKLSRLLRGMLCHINLIPVNPTKENSFLPGTKSAVQEFIRILEKNHLNVTVRRTLGTDISAACGQLRREKKA